MKKVLLITAYILLLSSCGQTILNVDPPEYTKKLIVNSFISNIGSENKISVSVNEKIYGKEEPIDNVDDAKVKIESGTKEYNFSHVEKSVFNFVNTDKIDFVEGQEYKLTVEKSGYTTATSTVKMPKSVKIDSVYIIKDKTINDGDGKVNEVELRFTDPAKEDNFYMVKVVETRSFNGRKVQLNINEGLNPVFTQSASYKELVFSDYTFDGKQMKLNFSLETIIDPSSSYELYFVAISKDKYEFEKRLYQLNQDDDSPFSSKVPLQTNIKNGLGLFSIDNETIYPIKIK